MQMQIEALKEAFAQHRQVFIEQIGELDLFVGFHTECAAAALANFNAVGEELVIRDVESVNGTTPREGCLLERIALVERYLGFTIGKREVRTVVLADLFNDVLLCAAEGLLSLQEHVEQGALLRDLIDRSIAHVVVKRALGETSEVSRTNRHSCVSMMGDMNTHPVARRNGFGFALPCLPTRPRMLRFWLVQVMAL